MVQIIDRPRTNGEKLAGAFSSMGEGLGQAIGGHYQAKESKRLMAEENEALSKLTGKDFSGILDPALKKEALGELLRGNTAREKGDLGQIEDQKTIETIRNVAGPKAAEMYEAASAGGRTKIMGAILDSAQRGRSFEDLYGTNGEKLGIQDEMSPQASNEPILDEENAPPKRMSSLPRDYDKGLTPRERASRQEHRYSTNLPIYQESHAKLKALEAEKEGLDILEELSPQITTMDKFNMNPMTGELIFPGLATPEAQRFVKTINDFTTRAKDSYGARVTNFDLTQFMKRLPTLANSEEGRRSITEQMKIINDINRAYESTLHQVIDEHGGIRNIDYDEAERLTDRRAGEQIKGLKAQFKQISNRSNKMMEKTVDELRRKVPNGSVLVEQADGDIGYLEKSELKDFLTTPGNKVL